MSDILNKGSVGYKPLKAWDRESKEARSTLRYLHIILINILKRITIEAGRP